MPATPAPEVDDAPFGAGRAILAAPVIPREAVPFDAERQARSLYWRGWGVTQIADEFALMGVINPETGKPWARATIESWKQRRKWDDAPMIRQMEDCTAVRLQALLLKDKKSGGDMKEIDLLFRGIERLARVRRYGEEGGHEGDLNGKVANRNAAPKKKAKRNHFDAEQAGELRRLFEETCRFGYQNIWLLNRHQRTRMILKSRQIGATYYFAFEALVDAVETGDNQIFLSASKRQALQFRTYMIAFAKLVGVELTGGNATDPMLITSELVGETAPSAELHFLGTNARTAQGSHGHFYFDEFFWVYGFDELWKVASGMASHKKWRRTMFSTPSTIAHEAHKHWTGEVHNRRRKKSDRLEIDTTHAALKDGQLGADNRWRHIVTLEDAEAQGCDLFDIDELKLEYDADAFANLFLCQFVDDSQSAFKFNDLVKCGADTLLEWTDFEPLRARPFGDLEVWAGYDPQEAEDGDDAALVIAAPPEKPGGKFRLLEKHRLRGDFAVQAAFVREKLARYRCTYLGIDATGVGAAVYQLLASEGSNGEPPIAGLTKLTYSLEFKQQLVMKAQHVITRERLKFEGSWVDLISSFVSIKRTLTQSGRAVTFRAGRGGDIGHADLAWAVMHVLINEPLDGRPKPVGTMEIIE